MPRRLSSAAALALRDAVGQQRERRKVQGQIGEVAVSEIHQRQWGEKGQCQVPDHVWRPSFDDADGQRTDDVPGGGGPGEGLEGPFWRVLSGAKSRVGSCQDAPVRWFSKLTSLKERCERDQADCRLANIDGMLRGREVERLVYFTDGNSGLRGCTLGRCRELRR